MLYHDKQKNLYFKPLPERGFVQVMEEDVSLPKTPLIECQFVQDAAGSYWVYGSGVFRLLEERLITHGLDAIQDAVLEWANTVLGEKSVQDLRERHARVLEEACEFVQASGMSRTEAHRMIDYVYDRPVGELGQELAGLLITAGVAASAHNLVISTEVNKEIERIWLQRDEIAEKQKKKPNLRDKAK